MPTKKPLCTDLILTHQAGDRTTPEANKSNNSAPNEGIGGRSVLATTTGCTMDNIPKNVQEKSLEAPSSRISTAAQASGASNITSSSTDAVVLLHFNRGGMYLHDFSHQALCNMARWLTNSEEENPPENKNMRMFVDVKERDRDPHVHKLTSSSTSSNRNFHANIKKYLGKPGFTFRVRTESIDTLSPFDVRTTGSLKLVRRNIGYCYVEIDWDKPYQLSQNSQRMEKAIDILFSWELSVDPNPDELFLEIPGHGFFHINRKADLVLGADIQKLFGTITRISSRLGADPTEIILHDSEQYTALMLGPEEEVENDNEVVDTAQPSPAGPQKAPVQKTAKILQPPEASTQPDQKHIARSKPPAAPTNEPRYVEKDDSSAVQHPQIVLHPPPVQGGPDLPAPYLRIVTLSETNKLQERLRKVEAQLAKSEERCQQSEKDHEATLTEVSHISCFRSAN